MAREARKFCFDLNGESIGFAWHVSELLFKKPLHNY